MVYSSVCTNRDETCLNTLVKYGCRCTNTPITFSSRSCWITYASFIRIRWKNQRKYVDFMPPKGPWSANMSYSGVHLCLLRVKIGYNLSVPTPSHAPNLKHDLPATDRTHHRFHMFLQVEIWGSTQNLRVIVLADYWMQKERCLEGLCPSETSACTVNTSGPILLVDRLLWRCNWQPWAVYMVVL